MSEREIQSVCDKRKSKGFKAPPYWTAEIYGFGKQIRDYGHYPLLLPLCISTDHGPSLLETPLKLEVDSDASFQFYHSPFMIKNWEKVTKRKGFVLYSPFVFYRRKHRISQSLGARGTIAFPAHTTRTIEDISNIELYAKQLLKLPKKFQPVSVCMYYDDIVKGKHKVFRKYKIPIYTAGYYFDNRFTERFYNILRNFKYATSNIVGSYLFYAVEMGLPFSIYGEKQKLMNKGDPNLSSGELDHYKQSKHYRKIFNMFKGLNLEITEKQREFIEENLGLNKGISRGKMTLLLYYSFLKWLFSVSVFRWLFKIIEVVVRRPYND